MSQHPDADLAFDPTVIQQLRQETGDVDGSLVASLVDAFAEEGAVQVAAIAAAWSARDLPTLAAAAHGLKGQALTFGLQGLVQRCKDVEVAAKLGDCPRLELSIPVIPLLFMAGLAVLRDHVADRR